MGPSRTKGATSPLQRRPEERVVVFQRPQGSRPISRRPFGARPRADALRVGAGLINGDQFLMVKAWLRRLPQPPRPGQAGDDLAQGQVRHLADAASPNDAHPPLKETQAPPARRAARQLTVDGEGQRKQRPDGPPSEWAKGPTTGEPSPQRRAPPQRTRCSTPLRRAGTVGADGDPSAAGVGRSALGKTLGAAGVGQSGRLTIGPRWVRPMGHRKRRLTG